MAEFNKSASSSASSSASAASSSSTATQLDASSYRLPGEVTMKHAVKLAIVEDRPIMLDYWTDSLEKKALIGVRENNEKLLVKSESEYTSVIGKFYKSGQEFIILTENSIYIVSADIPTKKIV